MGPAVRSPRLNRTEPSGVSESGPAESPDAAFEAFLAATYPKLVGTVALIVRDRGIAEDIVQETFARAWLSWGKLWPGGNPGGWTYRVATNQAIGWHRRAAREVRAVARLGRATPTSVAAPELHPELARAVASLPRRQRAAVALHYTLDLSIDDAAAAMDCRPGTVKSLLFDARKRLKEILGE